MAKQFSILLPRTFSIHYQFFCFILISLLNPCNQVFVDLLKAKLAVLVLKSYPVNTLPLLIRFKDCPNIRNMRVV